MAIDTQAMGLLIRMIPLLQREHALRVEPTVFFGDAGYREPIIDLALTSAEPRLQGYAQALRDRLAQLGSAQASGAPVVPATATPALPPAAAQPAVQSKYIGRLR